MSAPGFTSEPSQLDTASHCCVLVMENYQLLGIFTERDIIDLIATDRSVVTLTKTEHQDIFAALSLLRQHKIRYLPVLDINQKLIGIVTHNTNLQSVLSHCYKAKKNGRDRVEIHQI